LTVVGHNIPLCCCSHFLRTCAVAHSHVFRQERPSVAVVCCLLCSLQLRYNSLPTIMMLLRCHSLIDSRPVRRLHLQNISFRSGDLGGFGRRCCSIVNVLSPMIRSGSYCFRVYSEQSEVLCCVDCSFVAGIVRPANHDVLSSGSQLHFQRFPLVLPPKKST